MRSGVQGVGAEVEWGRGAGSGVGSRGRSSWLARGPPKAGLAASYIYIKLLSILNKNILFVNANIFIFMT